MNIGIVTSGHEALPLLTVLQKFSHDYHVFRDRNYRPWGDKNPDLVLERVQEGIRFLVEEHGVEKVIIPPGAEVVLTMQHTDYRYQSAILPLFTRYVLDHAFRYSLVGKVGLLCDRADMPKAEEVIRLLETQYTLTSNQQHIEKFHVPFALWKKEVRMWKYFLTTYGKRDRMVRKTIKTDLRYFKDAGVDTLIPMSWGFFHYQRMIRHMVSRKHMRLHGLEAVADCFEKLIPGSAMGPSSMAHWGTYEKSLVAMKN